MMIKSDVFAQLRFRKRAARFLSRRLRNCPFSDTNRPIPNDRIFTSQKNHNIINSFSITYIFGIPVEYYLATTKNIKQKIKSPIIMDRKIEKKKFQPGKIALYAVIIGAAGFFLSNIYKDAGTSRLNVETERLLIDTIQKGVFQEFIPISGVVQPIKTVFIGALEGGQVEEIFVEDGAMVQKGQPILRLSNSDLQVSYMNQEADIVSQINQIRSSSIMMEQQSLNLQEQALDADYRLIQAKRRLDRNKSLYNDEVISQVEFQENEDEYNYLQRRVKQLKKNLSKDSVFQSFQAQQMETTLDLMKRNLAVSKASLENLIVKAPISGQLSSLDKEIGELIAKGEKIAQIDLLDNFKVRARIDEYYISRIFNGQTGTFQFANETYELIIKKIYPDVTNGSFEVDLVFTSTPPKTIKRGQTVSIRLSLSNETQATLLERGSFYQTTGGNWVYVIDPNTGNAYKKEIKIGRQNPSYYEVLQGLSPGEIVITSSYETFNEKDELVLK